MTMMIRRVVLSIIASCHLPRSASLTPPMAFRTLPLTWSPLPSLWSLRSPVSFPATSFTLPFACSAEPLILSLSTMVRLLCCRDNVRKRKKLPGGNRAFPKKGQTIVLALGDWNERGRQLRRPRNDTVTPWAALFPVRPTVAFPITAALVLTPTVLFTRAPFPVVLMNDHAGL